LAQKPYYSVSTPQYIGNGYSLQNLPSYPFAKPEVSEGYTQNSETEKIQNKTEQKSNPKEILNLMNFGHKEDEIIKVMFENGAVKMDDRLLQKRIVKKHFAEDRLISAKDISNTYDTLEDMGLIIFKGGYRALADMDSIINTISK